jgi:hypothetical protein
MVGRNEAIKSVEGHLMPFLNECEECGNEYQADPKGKETWFTLCAACLVKENSKDDEW